VGWANPFQAQSLIPIVGKDNNTIYGGIVQHRFRYESSYRRRASVTLVSQDYIEPSDEYAFPGLRGQLDGETWLVSTINLSFSEGRLESRIECRTSKWYAAVRRSA
jgi:hypothetical protein